MRSDRIARKSGAMPTVSPRRITERAGIAAAQLLFETAGYVFQEVSQQNDFGKDAYVDLVDAGAVSPTCIALQIKSGRSYRTRSGDYFVPVGRHEFTWRESTIPVIGIVYDPDDSRLRWVDLTGALRSGPAKSGRVPVPSTSVLDASTLREDFDTAVRSYARAEQQIIPYRLLSDCADTQCEAVIDAWASARSDARLLIVVRRLVLHLGTTALRRAIWALAHATPHPDIFWTTDNWLEEPIKARLREIFRWSPDEIVVMFAAIEEEEWGRGTLGQSLDMLIREDPHGLETLVIAINRNSALGDVDALRAMIALALSLSEEPLRLLTELMQSCRIENDTWVREMVVHLQQFNRLDIY